MIDEDSSLDCSNSNSDSPAPGNPGKNIQNDNLSDIAHTLANLLTAIIGNVSMIRKEPDISGEVAGMLDETAEAALQAAETTKQLFQLSEESAKHSVVNAEAKKTSGYSLRLRKGKILFVDDEETVRKSTCRLLNKLGCEVETACNSKDAILLYKQALAKLMPFDAVILDLTFSNGVHGEDILHDLKGVDSSVKVILTSGHFGEDEACTYLKYGFDGVLPKPFSLTELDNVLKNLLD